MTSIAKLNQRELDAGISDAASWHNDYKDTSWVKIRGLDSRLSEGDVLCVFSQFGEIEDMNLIRRGELIPLCLIKFERFKSAVLTVDNFDGVELLGSRLSVDHHRETLKKPKRGEAPMSFADRLEQVQPGKGLIQPVEENPNLMPLQFPMLPMESEKTDEITKKKKSHKGETKEERRARRAKKREEKRQRRVSSSEEEEASD